jgi:hypothetical protein
LSVTEEVVALIMRKVFVEPTVVKYEQTLDKVTLWGGGCSGYSSSEKDGDK